MPQVTWLGDEDPSVQTIAQFGHSFVKGVPVDVDAKDDNLAMFEGNAFFSVGKSGDIVSSNEPVVDVDKGSEREAVRLELDAMGVSYDARLGVDKLRELLAKSK